MHKELRMCVNQCAPLRTQLWCGLLLQKDLRKKKYCGFVPIEDEQMENKTTGMLLTKMAQMNFFPAKRFRQNKHYYVVPN